MSVYTVDDVAAHIAVRFRESRPRPRTICITGEGGTGKTTLARRLATALNGDCGILEIDDFSMPRMQRSQLGLDGYHPDAFDIPSFRRCVGSLVAGDSVFVPHYSHHDGSSCRDRNCRMPDHDHWRQGRSVTIGVGVFLWQDDARHDWDLKIYLADGRDDKRHRRISRDTSERGYSLNDALTHYSMLEKSRRLYIERSLRYCEVVAIRSGEADFLLGRDVLDGHSERFLSMAY